MAVAEYSLAVAEHSMAVWPRREVRDKLPSGYLQHAN